MHSQESTFKSIKREDQTILSSTLTNHRKLEIHSGYVLSDEALCKYLCVLGIAGVNNFGVGGVNAHVLLEPNYKTRSEDSHKIADVIPRIVNICCRTEEAFNELCKWIEDNPQKVNRDFLALLAETMRVELSLKSTGKPYRG